MIFLIYFSIEKSGFSSLLSLCTGTAGIPRRWHWRWPVLRSTGHSDSVPVVGGGADCGGEAGDGSQKQEAAAAMAAVVPANSGEGGGYGEHQWSKGSAVVGAAWPGAAGNGGAPCGWRRPNRAATLGGGAGDVPATDWMGKERGKGVLGMENPFLPSISEDLRCMRRIWELYQWRKFRVSGIFPPVMTI
jgi:hypothetical protein